MFGSSRRRNQHKVKRAKQHEPSKTILGRVALKGSLEEMLELLQQGEDPNARHFSRSSQLAATPLWWSTWDVERVRLLLQFGADPEIMDTKFQSIPLEQAVTLEHIPAVVLLEAFDILQSQNISREDALSLLDNFTEENLADLENGSTCVFHIHSQLVLEAIRAIQEEDTTETINKLQLITKYDSLRKSEMDITIELAVEVLKSNQQSLINVLLKSRLHKLLETFVRKSLQADLDCGTKLPWCSIAWRIHHAIADWNKSQEAPPKNETGSTTFLPLCERGLAAQHANLLADVTKTWQELEDPPGYVLDVLHQFFGQQVWQKWLRHEIINAQNHGAAQLVHVMQSQQKRLRDSHRNSLTAIAKEPMFFELVLLARSIVSAIEAQASSASRQCKQTSSDLLVVFSRGMKVLPTVSQFIFRLSSKTGGRVVSTRLKTLGETANAIGLLEPSKQWNAENVLDVVQSVVAFDSIEQLQRFLNILVELDRGLELAAKRNHLDLEDVTIVQAANMVEQDIIDNPFNSLFVLHLYLASDAHKHICELHLTHKDSKPHVDGAHQLAVATTATGLLAAMGKLATKPTRRVARQSSLLQALGHTTSPELPRRETTPTIVIESSAQPGAPRLTPRRKLAPNGQFNQPDGERLRKLSNSSLESYESNREWKAAFDLLRIEVEALRLVVGDLQKQLDGTDK